MRRVIELYFVAFTAAGLVFVAGFTAAERPPPRWAMGGVVMCLLLALGGVLYFIWKDRAPSRS